MAVPYTFGTATASIPLSNLDANFATTITLGNTAIQLGNTVTTLNNMTLANVTVSSGNVTFTNVSATTANVTTANITTAVIGTATITTAGITTANVATGNVTTLVTTSVTNTGLTSGRVVFSTTNGLETDSANLTFNGTILTAAGFSGPLNGTVGATTPTTGAFTTLSATGVATFSAGTAALPAITTTGDTNTGIFFPAADTIAFTEGGAEAMRIDSSGNVGIGVTPSAWFAFKAIQIGVGSFSCYDVNNDTRFSSNWYESNTGAKYIETDFATMYRQSSGQHVWSIAPSGTAGATLTFTQAMTLDTTGNVGIGTTSPTQRLTVKSNTNGNQFGIDNAGNQYTSFNIYNNGTNKVAIAYDNTNALLQIVASAAASQMVLYTADTERMRIDAIGNVLVNTSSSTASSGQTAKLQVAGGIRTTTGFTSSISLGTIAQNATTTAAVGFNGLWMITNGSNNSGLILITLSGGSAGTQLVFSTSSDIVCGSTSEPSGGTYLRLWVSGGVLQVKNVNAYTGPWYMTPICTFGN
jgi:hypothetical protein